MYFSVITPTEGHEREAAHVRLDAPYFDHQWLWNWFPAPAGTARDFLFRRLDNGGSPRYYTVSSRAPIDLHPAWHLQTRAYAPELETGDCLAFDLRANPTVRHGRDGKSKRHDVVMEAKKRLLASQGLKRWTEWSSPNRPDQYDLVLQACYEWLALRGAAHGFELQPHAQDFVVDAHRQHQERADKSLKFTTVDLRGRLVVTDPQKFRQLLWTGIGSAKAMGCGLMLVRRCD